MAESLDLDILALLAGMYSNGVARIMANESKVKEVLSGESIRQSVEHRQLIGFRRLSGNSVSVATRRLSSKQ